MLELQMNDPVAIYGTNPATAAKDLINKTIKEGKFVLNFGVSYSATAEAKYNIEGREYSLIGNTLGISCAVYLAEIFYPENYKEEELYNFVYVCMLSESNFRGTALLIVKKEQAAVLKPILEKIGGKKTITKRDYSYYLFQRD
jgi:hypothetical protein